jgi:hypothetical protein
VSRCVGLDRIPNRFAERLLWVRVSDPVRFEFEVRDSPKRKGRGEEGINKERSEDDSGTH